MKQYRKLLIMATLLIICQIPWAAEYTGIDLVISFYNKKIYYLNQYDIFIKVNLINNSKSTFRCNIAQNKYFNLEFEVNTPTNLRLKHADKFIIERRSDQPAFFKELSLDPGEEYGFVVELNDFVTAEDSGVFIIQGLFYPELLRTGISSPALRSNKLTLNLRPPIMTEELQVLIEAETGKMLERMPLPPDEVVSYMITARQRSQWEKFFLYLDLEKLYTNNTTRQREYFLSTETERMLLLEEFKKRLKEDKIEQEIVVIPSFFKIDKTSYTANAASVIVTEKFDYPDYTAKKKYTYMLEKKDQFWLITGYIVENQGTE